MALRFTPCAVGVSMMIPLAGCSSPFDQPYDRSANRLRSLESTTPSGLAGVPESAYREQADDGGSPPALSAGSSADDYVRYALFNSPRVETAYQQWRAAAERLPQVGALPDPRLGVGFFLDELETRTGAQQARVGVQQSFPWFGQLGDRRDAASRAAVAAWHRFEATRLEVTERIVTKLHDLAYLDATIRITDDNLDLLKSFEGVLRARYRVGGGSHPELVRIQVELGQLEDRLIQFKSMRPAMVAELNAVLNRPASTPVTAFEPLPGVVAKVDAEQLAEIAHRTNPTLLAIDELVEEQRVRTEIARKDGLPDFTIGLDYLVTDEARDSSIPESGDDPILLSFGIRVPLWREKYEAGVRESVARRLSAASERSDQANQITAGIHRAWFEHTDADRRVRLFETTLIPKAEESLRASLAGFRAGETSFLDLLDTERTLLEFAVSAERAKADRGQALARLNRLVGETVPTRTASSAKSIQDQDAGTIPGEETP